METPAKGMEKLPSSTLEESMLRIQKDIDEFALELSLGKADAKDKFEEIKREFETNLTSLKHLFNKAEISQFVPIRLEWKLQDLELQLRSRNTGSRESFEAQCSALIVATIDIGKDVARVFQKAKTSNDFHHEVETFLLKLEIIRLKIGIKQFKIGNSFRSNMRGAKRVIRQISGKVQGADSKARNGKREVKREIAVMYKHLKSAVKNL